MAELLSHPVVAIVFLIGVLVFIHELGHFVIGKLCGIGVETFSIGFGPPIISFERLGTVYQLAWIPLGGYVKFAGALPTEEVADTHSGKEMYLASKTKRFLVISAGPVANFLLAFVIYTIMGMTGMEHAPAVIGTVMPNSPAYVSGLHSGDRIIAIDDEKISKWNEMHRRIANSPLKRLRITVKRQEREIDLVLIPEKVKGQGRAGVGLNYEKPIVTVFAESLVARHGLQTGDEIITVRFAQIQAGDPDLDAEQVDPIPDDDLGLGEEQVVDDEIEVKTFAQLQHVFSSTKADFIYLRVQRNGKEEAVAIPYQKSLHASGIVSSLLTIAETEDGDSGLLPYDHIVAAQGKNIKNIYDLYEILRSYREPRIEMTVIRNGKEINIDVGLQAQTVQELEGAVTVYTLKADFMGKMYRPPSVVERYPNPLQAMLYGLRQTQEKTMLVVSSLAGLFTGAVPIQALGGPILIAKVAGDSVKAGWDVFFITMAIISINLGVINLFPIPVLDGGQLLLVGMECIRRRRLTMTTIENMHRVGFVMIMCLVVMAFYNDLSRFWQPFLESIAGFFE